MARNYKAYASRAGGYAKRTAGGYAKRGRAYGSKRNRKLGINSSIPFLIGLGVGLTNMDDKIPKELTLGLAVAPVKGIGELKGGAQGVVFGNMLQQKFGIGLGGNAGTSGSFGV